MSLTIVLSNDFGPPHFKPGDEIIGYVLLEVEHPKYCESIEITLQGKAIVRVIKNDKLLQDNIKCVEETEEYINESITLLEDEQVSKRNSKFPFTFDLPEDIPCSFVGTHGLVKYSLTACMKCTGEPTDEIQSTNLTLIIAGFLDLNESPPSLLQDYGPLEVSQQFQGGWCCLRGNRDIWVQMNITKRTVVPSESLPFQILIENNSCSDLMRFTVQLVRTATCKAKGNEISKSKVMDQIAGPSVPKKSSQQWDIENFGVPLIRSVDLPPSGLGGHCSIIDVQYSLKVSMFVEQGCSDGSAVFSVPILIGTVPLELDNMEDTS